MKIIMSCFIFYELKGIFSIQFLKHLIVPFKFFQLCKKYSLNAIVRLFSVQKVHYKTALICRKKRKKKSKNKCWIANFF